MEDETAVTADTELRDEELMGQSAKDSRQLKSVAHLTGLELGQVEIVGQSEYELTQAYETRQ